jgi:hypothetical protein
MLCQVHRRTIRHAYPSDPSVFYKQGAAEWAKIILLCAAGK